MCCLNSLTDFPDPLTGLRKTKRCRGTKTESSSLTATVGGGGCERVCGGERERERERERESRIT